MTITIAQIQEARKILRALKPKKIVLDSNRSLTTREAIFALAPTLERMKKRGFEMQEIVERLHEKGIDIKSATLARYLNEYKRGKDKKADTTLDNRQNTTQDSKQGKKGEKDKTHPAPQAQPKEKPLYGGFEVIPDRPDDEL